MQLQSPAASGHLLTLHSAATADVELQLAGLEITMEE